MNIGDHSHSTNTAPHPHTSNTSQSRNADQARLITPPSLRIPQLAIPSDTRSGVVNRQWIPNWFYICFKDCKKYLQFFITRVYLHPYYYLQYLENST